MKVLLVGSGAREHALAWKLNRSSSVGELYLWPEAPALEGLGTPIDGEGLSWAELAQKAKDKQIDYVVVGPEQPLAEGLADQLEALSIPVFGPKKAAAQLESSKHFAKRVMKEASIPTAAYEAVSSFDACRRVAYDMVSESGGAVLKASGLAGGKGVFVCSSKDDVDDGLLRLEASMAEAASTIVVEQVLQGRECSFFCMVGKERATPLGFAVDFKRLKDGDAGPNTGGMGCYSPVSWLPEDATDQVMDRVVTPLLKQLRSQGIDYCGYLYVGLMWGDKGPQVVEFNVRLGDPEAQVLVIQDGRDWGAMIADHLQIKKAEKGLYEGGGDESCSIVVIMASEGYPFEKPSHDVRALPQNLFENAGDDILVFGAAVKKDGDKLYPGSGRVISIACKDELFSTARQRAYGLVHDIAGIWPEAQYRRDIALKVSKSD